MKIVATAFSPFVSRVKMQVKLKKLAMPFVEPDAPLRSDEFKRTYPLGKVPILVLDNGVQIPESTAIMRFLEREFQTPSLLPTTSADQAQMDVLINLADLYVGPTIFTLFNALLSPEQLDKKHQAEAINKELDRLNRFLIQRDINHISKVNIGDLCLSTTFFFVEELLQLHDLASPLEQHKAIGNWWAWVRDNVIIHDELSVLQHQFRAFLEQFKTRGDKN